MQPQEDGKMIRFPWMHLLVRLVSMSLYTWILFWTMAGESAVARDRQYSQELQGTIGSLRVKINLGIAVLNSDQDPRVSETYRIANAHYFYAKWLTDIPLTASISGEEVTLTEPSGGSFHLKMLASGSPIQNATLKNFYLLEGTWEKRGRMLPVRLTTEFSRNLPFDRPLYRDVTDEPPLVFEKRIQLFLLEVYRNDCHRAADFIQFPLIVWHIPGKVSPFAFGSKSEVCAHWAQIFPTTLKESLREDIPHELAVGNSTSDNMVMYANGVIYFGPKGAREISEFKD